MIAEELLEKLSAVPGDAVIMVDVFEEDYEPTVCERAYYNKKNGVVILTDVDFENYEDLEGYKEL